MPAIIQRIKVSFEYLNSSNVVWVKLGLLLIWLLPIQAYAAPLFPEASFAVGRLPFSVTSADFNGDGKADLAVANRFTNNVSVLLGDGAGGFAPAVQLRSGGQPDAVTSADFNGDGKADLAVTSLLSNNVSVLLGDGAGGFAPAGSFAVGANPLSVTSADFNGDGRADLAVANGTGGTVSVLLGNGAGGFAPAVNFATAAGARSVTSADFNGDGRADLAVANGTGGTVSVLLGDGAGGFAPAVNFAAAGARSVISADFNGDGRADLAVANAAGPIQAGTVSVLLGNGAGGFAPAVNFTVGIQPSSVVSADFNGDGKADLAVSKEGTRSTGSANNISVLLGNGAGGFAPAVNFAAGGSAQSVVSADFNGDGKADLAAANADSGNSAGTVSVLLGDGTGSFATAINVAAGAAPRSVTSADFNGDGNLDMAVAGGRDTVSVLLGDGTGGFAPAVSFTVGFTPVAVVSADFNGDGNLDMAVSNNISNTVSVLLGDGAGGFAPAVNFAAGVGLGSVISADFNGDGKADLAATNVLSNNVSVLLGDGAGGFAAAVNFAAGPNPESVTSADFNGDGNLDLAVAGLGGGSATVRVLLGDGTGGFAPAVNFAAGLHSRSIISADFNGDGKADLAVANSGDGVSVLLGDGAGGFAPAVNLTVGFGPNAVTSADFNGDGKTDLAVVNGTTDNVSVLLGDGVGGFAPAVNFVAAFQPGSVTSADFNGDGKTDLAVAGGDGVRVLLNRDPRPVAVADRLTATKNTAATTGDVLANDIDTNQTGSLTITAVDLVSAHGGTVTNNRNNTFTYLPPVNFTGSDSFTYTITDGLGKTAVGTVTVSVTVGDTMPPVISVPADVIVEATGPLTPVAIGPVAANDLVDGPLSATPDNTGPFPIGTTVVTYSVTDAAGNTATATQNVTVVDTTAPSVIPPASITVEATGPATAVTLGAASASDLVDGALTATPDITGPFVVGMHTITWSATDSHGNTGTATQTVTVTDTTAPVITVPAATVDPVTGAVNLGVASAVDTVDGVVSVTNNAPGAFPVGTTIVTYTATDAAGNTATATQTVVVPAPPPPAPGPGQDIDNDAEADHGDALEAGDKHEDKDHDKGVKEKDKDKDKKHKKDKDKEKKEHKKDKNKEKKSD